MRDLFGRSTGRSALSLITLIAASALLVAACSGGGSGASAGADQGGASAAAGGNGSSGGGAAASTDTSGGGGGGGSGEDSASGNLVSSGAYDATWTWQSGNAVGPGIGGITLNSDKGTYGSVEVLSDGSITFSTGAPDVKGAPFRGTGAQVQDKDGIPCAFTLDNDLTGSDGSVLHLKGQLAIHSALWNC